MRGMGGSQVDPRLEAFWKAASEADYSVTLDGIPAVANLLATDGVERAGLARQCSELFVGRRTRGLSGASPHGASASSAS